MEFKWIHEFCIQTPNQYFSNLISNNNLIYATAFNPRYSVI